MKFQLPHSEAEIAAAKAAIERLKVELKATEDNLSSMYRANREAERAEEKRRAQKLTPAGRKVLEVLAAEESTRLESQRGFGSYTTSYHFYRLLSNGMRTFPNQDVKVIESTVDRLRIAGYIELTEESDFRSSVYAITDAGRAALASKGCA